MNRFVVAAALSLPLQGMVIKVDYSLDENGFFDDPAARVVMEAAAARWSRVVNQKLKAIDMKDEVFIDGRFELIHPATGERRVYSAAEGVSTDFYVQVGQPPADEYLGGFTLDEDVWILFVGGRNMDSAARGGPIGGAGNLSLVYDDPESYLNRGFNVGTDSLAVIGGVVTFSLNRDWNFNLAHTAEPGVLDFYSVALHEIGHGLGLNSRAVAEWADLLNGNLFIGTNAISAYQEDSGLTVQGIEIENEDSRNYHWQLGSYDSKIFELGTPLYFGTVGRGRPQNLLMEPGFFFEDGVRRVEITNVDLGALRDLGWSVISEKPPLLPELPVFIGKTSQGELSVQINTEVETTYTVQTSPDGVSWVNVIPSLVGDGGPMTWVDGKEGFCDPYGPASSLPGKYYRIIKD